MADTPKLGMPYIAESQYTKYVTHNEALDDLDALVQLTIKDRDLSTPPGSPASGDTYIVAATGLSTWAGHDNDLAIYISSQWKFHDPQEGWQGYVQDENVLVRWDGSAWQVVAEGTTFLGLTDTESSYTGHTLELVRVNAAETGLEFVAPSGGAVAFTDLTDVDPDYTGDGLKYVRVNAGETGLEFAAGTSGAYTDLTDTEASYSGAGTKFLAVKATEDGIEFVTAAGGSLGMSRGALVKLSSDEILTTSVAEKLAWDAVEYDTNAIWSGGSPTRLTVPAGVTKCYLVGQVAFDGPAYEYRRLHLLKNNASFVGRPAIHLPVESGVLPPKEPVIGFCSPPLVVTPGDYFELELYHESGGDINVLTGDNTWMAMVLITDSELTPQTKTLTDALTNLFEIALPAAGMTGGEITATIRASDGTDHQVLTQRIVFAAVNKAGTYTTTLNVDVGNELTVATSGTLTATWAVTNGANKITIGVTPAGSLTESTYNIYFQVVNNSPHVVTYL